MANEDLVLTREKKEELQRAFEEIASDVVSDTSSFEFDVAEVGGLPYLRAVEEYETHNFTIKLEVKGGTDGDADAPGEPGEGA